MMVNSFLVEFSKDNGGYTPWIATACHRSMGNGRMKHSYNRLEDGCHMPNKYLSDIAQMIMDNVNTNLQSQ